MSHRTRISAFSEDHVVRLTGLTRGQLRSWERSGFFQPRFASEDRHAPQGKIYSFQDVVGLRTMAILIKDYRISIQKLRKVADELTRLGYERWAEAKLYVVKGEIYFNRPVSDALESARRSQLVVVALVDVIHDVEVRVRELQVRDDSQRGHVERNKFVMSNSAVIAGTRITTAAIRRFTEEGFTVEQIIKQYPALTPEDVRAALAHEEGLAHSV